jgi:FtsZ-binding cell division protein ZapB
MEVELDSMTDSLTTLEERIVRAVEIVTALREENTSLRRQLAESEGARAAAERLAREVAELRSERKQVRSRIEKLLGQMDLLSAT